MVMSVFAMTVAFSGGAAAQVANDDDGPDVQKVTHYENSSESTVVEIAFNENVSGDVGNETVTLNSEDGPIVTAQVNDSNIDGARVELTTSSLFTNVTNATISNITDADGNEMADSGDDFDVTTAPETIDPESDTDDDIDAYRGSNVALEADSNGTSFDIEGPGVSRVRGTGDGSQVYVLDTENFELGEYNITDNGQEVTGTITLNDLGLSATADSTDITTEDDVVVTAESNDIGRTVEANLLNSDGDSVDSATEEIESDGDVDINFGNLSDLDEDAGDYTVEVEDVNTGVTAETDTITVSEPAEGDVSFAETTVSEQTGDIAEITVNMDNADTATLVIGSSDQNYFIETELVDEDDDGEVTAEFNTYTAGSNATDSETITAASDDDTATLVEEGGDFNSSDEPTEALLAPVSYDMNVSAGSSVNENTDSVGALSLRPRETESHAIWTAPESTTPGDLDVSAVYSSIGSSITETDEVVKGDDVVHQITASGIEGAVQYHGGINSGPFSVTVEQAESDPNADVKELSYNNNATISDPANDTYFVAYDTAGDDNANTGDTYDAEFTITGDGYPLADDDQTASASFDIVEVSGSLDTNDNDEIILESSAGQEVTGETNLAPGTDLRVRIASQTTASPYRQRPQATVQSDGTFSVTADLSNVDPGTELEVAVLGPNGDELNSYDGTVAEAPTASVTFDDQTSNGTTVTVASVTMSDGGFIAIHNGSASGAVIGHSEYLEAGNSENVEITLDEPLSADGTLVAMPHLDTNNNSEYEFDGGSTDAPYTGEGEPVTSGAAITVEETTETPTDTETETETDTETETETDTETETETEMTDTETETETGTETETETTAGDGPGFGVIVSILALVAAALLAVRRNN
jgi:PGF-CTERM protein